MPTDNPAADDFLAQDVSCLRGATPLRREQLGRLGITTVRDLLFDFPRAYEDLTDLRPVADLQEGALQTVQGEVVEIDGDRLADGRCIVRVVLSDGGKVCLEGVWFNQPYAARRFRYGQRLAFSGKVKWHRDHWQMSAPRVQVLDGPDPDGRAPALSVVPVYSLTEDLRPEQLRPLIRQAVDRGAGLVAEVLPE
ncbi:MAG TPA: hypothetical protein VJ739_07430, partial [Gemmataceae bacterium]|nr:hypothetical protein [Gemmataceae bacterium]